MEITFFRNSKYFILFIDDFNRMTLVYFIKEKTQVFEIFKEFVNSVEIKSRCALNILHFDDEKEHISSQFDMFCGDLCVHY